MTFIIGALWLLLQMIASAKCTDFSKPVSPRSYSSVLGSGFSTNWFKSKDPMSKYNDQNIVDVYNAGFRNLRLRCLAENYPYPYATANFTSFLNDLEHVVDKCLEVGVAPIITWIHHHAEAYGLETDRENYLIWWKKVAEKLKNKDYRLSFNLFTELGVDVCQKTGNCDGSLRVNTTKYNIWTSQVVEAIRGTGGNNAERILILSSPQKTAKGLHLIDANIYKRDHHMMVEYHTYASGPNKKSGSPKFWQGTGTPSQRQSLLHEIELANTSIPLFTYFGAWMPLDNTAGSISQAEAESFSEYFVSVLKQKGIPWSMNVLDDYYNTKRSKWLTRLQTIAGQDLHMSAILDVIKRNMI